MFVLANAASIGAGSLNGNSTWAELNESMFGNNQVSPYYGFGLNHVVTSVDSELGLPMSACQKNMKVQGSDPSLYLNTLTLTRMVSRIRFVFCRTKTDGENPEDVDLTINSIQLRAFQIPKKEYLFTTDASGVVITDTENLDNNYEGIAYNVTPPAVIAENEAPENLIYVNQDPLVYEQSLADAVASNSLTDLGFAYFRESDLRLVGTIEYTVGGKTHIRDINMALKGDFARNHTWTVFGYFVSGRNLQLSLSVKDWDYSAYYIDFKKESVSVSSKFVVDESSAVVTETSEGHFDVKLIPGLPAKGHLYITTPRGGDLMITAAEGDMYAFKIVPEIATIDPSNNSGRIDIEIWRNPKLDEDLTGKYLVLFFQVEVNDRVIEANSEIVDNIYRFVL